MKAGYEAQIKSVVMLKNKENILPLKKKLKVYIPQKFIPGGKNWFGIESSEKWVDAANLKIAKNYFDIVQTPDEADVAFVIIDSPQGGTGYSTEDLENGGNGYMPISLQYSAYKADFARAQSVAGGSPYESFTNRTYKGKVGTTANKYDMQVVNETKAKMGEKPVVVIVNVSKPMVFSEIEKSSA